MHLLSERQHSEFLAVPELVRATMAHGESELEPTLLIKTSSLSLKYLVRLQTLQLVFVRLSNGHLGYGVQLDSDPDHAGVVWSVVEREDERVALTAMSETSRCVVFLFNELAISVASTDVGVAVAETEAAHWLSEAALAPNDDPDLRTAISALLDAYLSGEPQSHVCALAPIHVRAWREVRSHYITNRATTSLVSIFEKDEGGQQEEVALWLIDSLDPKGAVKSPFIHYQTKSRELTDLLLSYEQGAFFFESKSLSVLRRDNLPIRRKLGEDLKSHIRKAERQLSGGIRGLRAGHRVTDERGVDIVVEREKPIHAIILTPDLALLSDAPQFGGALLRSFAKKTGCFLQILDPAELLLMVQAAEMLEQRGEKVTRMMCFDAHLFRRWEHAIDLETPHFDFLFRIE